LITLAIDTSEARGSIVLRRDGSAVARVAHVDSSDYSEWLLRAVQQVLDSAATRMESIELLAVATGPGSFTGVRVGLTTVKAWAEVYGPGVVGVSRLEALASCERDPAGLVAAYYDAQRGQVFGGCYRSSPGRWTKAGDELVLAPEAFLESVKHQAGDRTVSWVSLDPELVTGLSAWRERAERGDTMRRSSAELADAIGWIAEERARAGELTDPLKLDANYVRRSDAEIFWKGLGRMRVEAGDQRVEIRSCLAEDLTAIERILQGTPEAAGWSANSLTEVLGGHPGHCLVAVRNGQLAGFIAGRSAGAEAEILNLVVEQSARRRGIGQSLVQNLLRRYTTEQVLTVYLEVRESNLAAMAFYAGLGFEQVGRRERYYRNPEEDALVLKRELVPHG
jgi:tRNA threonylcarbamoyladenosine biosynthesis protein TsaB